MGNNSNDIDYFELASMSSDASQAAQLDETYTNRPDQYTPFGSTTFTSGTQVDPLTGEQVPNWTQTTALSQPLQNMLNLQQGIDTTQLEIGQSLMDRVETDFLTPMEWGGLSPMGEVPEAQYTTPELSTQAQFTAPGADVPTQFTTANSDIGNAYETRQAAEDAVYGQAMSRIAPQQDSQRQALELKLRNQGLNPEDAAWKSQMQGQNQGFNDQNNQALWSANEAGRQESDAMYGQLMGQNQNAFNQNLGANAQNFGQMIDTSQNSFNQDLNANAQNFGQMFDINGQNFNQNLTSNAQNYDMGMSNSAYANAIRQQQLAEDLTKRGQNLNEVVALTSGQQVGLPQMPSFSQSSAYQPADFVGAGVAQASASAAADPTNALVGAAGSLGAAALSNPAIFTGSDRRLKYNIKRIGTNKGYPWYSYNLKYDGSAHEGVMADEVPKKYTIDIAGIKAVNYGALLGE